MSKLFKSPKLVIWMVTYNHEKYIEQAVESIMAQQTNFDFQLFIGEDCSTDNTRNICLELKNKYPDAIKLVLNNKNIGSNKNGMSMYDLCYKSNAKYIALCEGDDYWTDSFKLQKQVDFLEANPDYEVCFTNINIINDKGEETKEQLITTSPKTTYTQKDLPLRVPTLTRVFKNRDFSNLQIAPGMDTIILLYQAQFGKIKYIDEITGTYRQHDSGAYTSKSKAKRKEHNFLTLFGCLQLLKPPLLYKYYGMLFKKLVELKRLNSALFKKRQSQLKKEYKSKKSSFSKKEQRNIAIGFLLLKTPFFEHSKLLSKVILILLNRKFIY